MAEQPCMAQPPLGKQSLGELGASPGWWEAQQPLQSKQEISQRLQTLGTSLGEQMGREHSSNLQTLQPLLHCRGWQENLGVGCLSCQASPFPTKATQLSSPDPHRSLPATLCPSRTASSCHPHKDKPPAAHAEPPIPVLEPQPEVLFCILSPPAVP